MFPLPPCFNLSQRDGDDDVLAMLYSADRLVWYSNTNDTSNKSNLFQLGQEQFIAVGASTAPPNVPRRWRLVVPLRCGRRAEQA
jgi:hypothetical protein